MKYFLLFVIVVGGIYVFYENDRAWNHNDLKTLVMEKSEDLCVMPELLEQYNITSGQCETIFKAQMGSCLEEIKQNYSNNHFESKALLLKAFNQSLSCIVLSMESGE